MSSIRVSTGGEWEKLVAYSRVVCTEQSGIIAVAGTVGDGKDAEEQTRFALNKIIRALKTIGCDASDIIRTRIYVVDIERDWRGIGKAHYEVFGPNKENPKGVYPANSMIQIAKLIDPKFLVEIEVDAVRGHGKSKIEFKSSL